MKRIHWFVLIILFISLFSYFCFLHVKIKTIEEYCEYLDEQKQDNPYWDQS
jgi:hypothetical protein